MSSLALQAAYQAIRNLASSDCYFKFISFVMKLGVYACISVKHTHRRYSARIKTSNVRWFKSLETTQNAACLMPILLFNIWALVNPIIQGISCAG